MQEARKEKKVYLWIRNMVIIDCISLIGKYVSIADGWTDLPSEFMSVISSRVCTDVANGAKDVGSAHGLREDGQGRYWAPDFY